MVASWCFFGHPNRRFSNRCQTVVCNVPVTGVPTDRGLWQYLKLCYSREVKFKTQPVLEAFPDKSTDTWQDFAGFLLGWRCQLYKPVLYMFKSILYDLQLIYYYTILYVC